MKHKSSQLLYAYWNTVRGSRIAPKRFDIEPGRLGTVLPDTFILELNGDGSLVYRLAGTRLSEGFSQDLRGRDFLEGLSAEDRAKLAPQIDSVISKGAVLVQVIEIENSAGTRALIEVLLLPLVHTRNMIDRFVGSIVWLSDPVPLKEHTLQAKRLQSSKLFWPNGLIKPPVLRAPGLDSADRQSPFVPHIRNARIVRQDRRQFRVYDGGLTKPPLDKH